MWGEVAAKAPIAAFMVFMIVMIVVVVIRARSGRATLIDRFEEHGPPMLGPYFDFVRRFQKGPFYIVYAIVFGVVVVGILTYALFQPA